MTVNIIFDEPIEIGGQTVILTSDEVNEAASDVSDSFLIMGESRKNAAIWASERAVERVREAHPDLPVYGLWQVLLKSGAIDIDRAGHGRCGFVLRSDGASGHVLILEDGRAVQTAQFPSEQMLQMFGLNPDITFDIDIGTLDHIQINVDPIRLPKEVGEYQVTVARRQQMMVVGLVAVVLIGAGALHYMLDMRKAAVLKEVQQIKAQISPLNEQLVATKARKLTLNADDHLRIQVALSRLAEITQATDSVKVEPSLLNAPIDLTVKRFSPALSFPYKASGSANGDISIRFSPDGTADDQFKSAAQGAHS